MSIRQWYSLLQEAARRGVTFGDDEILITLVTPKVRVGPEVLEFRGWPGTQACDRMSSQDSQIANDVQFGSSGLLGGAKPGIEYEHIPLTEAEELSPLVPGRIAIGECVKLRVIMCRAFLVSCGNEPGNTAPASCGDVAEEERPF